MIDISLIKQFEFIKPKSQTSISRKQSDLPTM